MDAEDSFNWNVFFQELLGESDRACAIVGAAILDAQLEALLRTYLVDDKQEQDALLHSANVLAPLSSFGPRITAAYLLGSISKIVLSDLRKIKDVRNEFGHRPSGLSFEDLSIAKLVEKLEVPNLMTRAFHTETGIPMPSPNPRERFTWTVTMLIGYLRQRRKTLEQVRLTQAPALRVSLESVDGISDAIGT